MASVTKKDDEKLMASDEATSGDADIPRDDDRESNRDRNDRQPPRPVDYQAARAPGFFTIYKPGQGYWTRLGTGLAAGLMLVLVLHFLWTTLPPWIVPAFAPDAPTNEQMAAATAKARQITLGICVAAGLALGIFGWRLMNKPTHVDFLIATDSEMKKVNWTSRKDLIGSTKVVILFMFLIAAFLFVVDVLFGYVFYFIRVLRTPPF